MWQAKITGLLHEINVLLTTTGIEIVEGVDGDFEQYMVNLPDQLERQVNQGRELHLRLGESEILIEQP